MGDLIPKIKQIPNLEAEVTFTWSVTSKGESNGISKQPNMVYRYEGVRVGQKKGVSLVRGPKPKELQVQPPMKRETTYTGQTQVVGEVHKNLNAIVAAQIGMDLHLGSARQREQGEVSWQGALMLEPYVKH